MNTASNQAACGTASRTFRAHLVPFLLFVLLQMLPGPIRAAGMACGMHSIWINTPEYWLYALQALVCGAALVAYRKEYRFSPGAAVMTWGFLIGIVAWFLWISPQMIWHAAPRIAGGFDPTPLAREPAIYGAVLVMRCLRLAVVVPFVEEVFWRGFLLRFLVREEFGRARYLFTPISFGIVAVLFMLEHQSPDWAAALMVGALYNGLAIRSQSLGACVLAHAATNALLGIYVLETRQWGFW